jgi:NAD(P)H-dependent FMN reductase
VTPQYNWSIPASLKNALDYLYYEWKDKPAAIVTYGGRGGGKAADHLSGILQGLHMNGISITPGLIVKTTTMESLEGQQIGAEDKKRWQESGAEEQISTMFSELLKQLHSK